MLEERQTSQLLLEIATAQRCTHDPILYFNEEFAFTAAKWALILAWPPKEYAASLVHAGGPSGRT